MEPVEGEKRQAIVYIECDNWLFYLMHKNNEGSDFSRGFLGMGSLSALTTRTSDRREPFGLLFLLPYAYPISSSCPHFPFSHISLH